MSDSGGRRGERGGDGETTIGVVVSRADEASVHVGDRLLEVAEWREVEDSSRPDADGGGRYYRRDGFELRQFDELHLNLDQVADTFDDPELVVFVSRHAGETGPLLTAHFTGNVGPAEYGGRPNELARACPNAHATVLEALARHAPEGYDVGMECTHHGPSRVGAPSMFVEVGSAESQWRDPAAATAAARAVLDLEGVSSDRDRTVVGFGGDHYAPRFGRVARETNWAVGHVVADWALEATGGLSPELVDQAFARSAAKRAMIDGEQSALVEAIERRGYEVVSETWARETVGVPLEVVERVETKICSIDDGLRFGELRAEDLIVDEVNPELVGAALGVDADSAVRAIERRVVAYETEEAGNRPTGRLCVPREGSIEPVVDSLASILRRGGATVDRGEDVVVVRSSKFDPEKARELGVPEGPAFGRLAAGETVVVEGEPVTPDAVHTTRTRRYPIRRERS